MLKNRPGKLVQIALGLLFMTITCYLLIQGHGGILTAVLLLPTTALQKVNLMTEEAWATNQRNEENQQVADSLEAGVRNQATLGKNFVTKLEDSKKDNHDVRILWVDFCGEVAEDCNAYDNYCDGITGSPAGVDFKDYNLTQCVTDDFSVDENVFAGSFMDFNDYVRQNQNQKIMNLLTLLNKKYLLFLHANAGYNAGQTFNFNGSNQSEVPTAQYANADLITDMIIDAQISRVGRPFGLDGRNLLKAWLNAEFNSADGGEAMGNVKRKRFFDWTFDPFGFANAGVAVAGSTFLVSPYAYAIVNKHYYDSSVPVYDNDLGMWKYFIRIPAFGLTVDVLHQRTCVDAKKDRWSHVWKYTLHYDFLTNPFGCPDGEGNIVTGILEYKKVA